MTLNTDAQSYKRAMIAGDIDACIEIEQRNELYGYPPSLVSACLTAIEQGRDPHEEIDAFIDDVYDDIVEGDD